MGLGEAELVRRCQRGDVAAFEALFARYSRRVLQTAYLITGSRSTAEDILQEAFVQTFRSIAQLREPQAFPGWLLRIAVRTARRYMQQESAMHRSAIKAAGAEAGSEPAPDNQVVVRHAIWAAVGRLSDQRRIAVVLHYFEDRPVGEIADLLEVPEGTVKSWLYRARSALAAQLGQESWGGGDAHG
jgi:RNA polymerase sigma-70 factor, ECF subfamily